MATYDDDLKEALTQNYESLVSHYAHLKSQNRRYQFEMEQAIESRDLTREHYDSMRTRYDMLIKTFVQARAEAAEAALRKAMDDVVTNLTGVK